MAHDENADMMMEEMELAKKLDQFKHKIMVLSGNFGTVKLFTLLKFPLERLLRLAVIFAFDCLLFPFTLPCTIEFFRPL